MKLKCPDHDIEHPSDEVYEIYAEGSMKFNTESGKWESTGEVDCYYCTLCGYESRNLNDFKVGE